MTSSGRQLNFADAISLIHIIASIGQLAHEDTSLLKFIRQTLKFLKSRPGLEFKLFSPFFLGVVSLSLHLFWLLQRNTGTFRGCPGNSRTCSTARMVEMDGQANGHSLQHTNSAPPCRSRWCHQYPTLHYLWQHSSICIHSRS